MFWDRLFYMCEKKNCKPNTIAKNIGLSTATATKWKKGAIPNGEALIKIADFLNCSIDYLLERTDNPKVNELDNTIQFTKPDDITESSIQKKILPFYRTAASAGTGSYLYDDTPVEYINVPKTDNTVKADYILEVRGNSMEPKFFDGDCVLIKQSDSIYEGEIGIFIVNNESYIKKMGRGELISLNPAYAPIRLHEYDDIRCAGKVIDTVVLE